MIERLFAERVSASELRGQADPESLLPQERAASEGFGARRLAEFAAGRACARDALARIGIREFPLLRRPDRSPAWPPGIIGSITHTGSYSAAVVAAGPPSRAIGIDAEIVSRVVEDLWSALLTVEEERGLMRVEPANRQLHAALAFSAKEAFFKAQWPLTSSWLEFQDVVVQTSPGTCSGEGSFTVRTLRDAAPAYGLAERVHAGRYRVEGDLIVTGICITASEAT
jgi:4'-phosphopantetheinyl transferase EntD